MNVPNFDGFDALASLLFLIVTEFERVPAHVTKSKQFDVRSLFYWISVPISIAEFSVCRPDVVGVEVESFLVRHGVVRTTGRALVEPLRLFPHFDQMND
ncbi:hypothetical protein [Haladaptatus sp. DFWS20]|uniref:hypothetical protein n=1 Tax=Haladaptatus sp. DFWS20 TaxID=3403467 RepID=UPI003EBC0652